MIAVIDYRAGNAPSVAAAIKHTGMGETVQMVREPRGLENASRIILPGVGAAGATMDSLRKSGFTDALGELVLEKGVLFLGICIGMQILFENSAEDNAECLGWLKGKVVKFDGAKVKVPQMGWNKAKFVKDTAMSKNGEEDYFYFVNSYHVQPEDKNAVMSLSEYGGTFVSAVNYRNIFGAQFHVEKSGAAGLELLKRFLKA